jgi:maltose alpha-D-glucosyltransferase/alpha-amylase
VHLLIALFEAEKVFYELAYELNNRPDWAWIPMRGISKLLAKR